MEDLYLCVDVVIHPENRKISSAETNDKMKWRTKNTK